MKDRINKLRQALNQTLLADRQHLEKRLKALAHANDEGMMRELAALDKEIAASAASVRTRITSLPNLEYPPELPVSLRHQELCETIAANQVTIVCGETGSGKTTQLPKLCLEIGRGIHGLIGHTQPRRLAARSVAARISEELGGTVGTYVGYKVRFSDKVSKKSYIKLMTDGILLAEILNDRDLLAYDTLIIDEAHERSLNIDFLLGYLKPLLARRPELKLIITSATIDPERFARHFNGAPIIEVSGRSHPIEIRYRPLTDPVDPDRAKDLSQGILDAVDELATAGPGDILVFLSGEREIRETAESLHKHHPRQTEIVPLYARLSATEQNKVFRPHKGRRIVLATNVAETSLTVPGIRYVIDPGTARLSRYSVRNKIQRLPIEKISQANARQRAGRCGRVAPGICIRLYDEEDFNARPVFTEPEILRTNLAAVILQMSALGLGKIENYPFIDPPDGRLIRDGLRLLEELGAMKHGRITTLGHKLSRFSVDPRMGRMLLEASNRGALNEVLVITSALSLPDVRERPADKQQQADMAHVRFANPCSDFISLLNLWKFYVEQRNQLSRNKLTKLCRQNFLSPRRMAEWHDLHQQLHTQASQTGLHFNSCDADVETIHQSLLVGLLGHIGMRDTDREYEGARNRRFMIFPGSAVAVKPPKWIMVASLIETSRLYGHTAAHIAPEWIEQLAGHLIKRHHTNPHYNNKRAQVIANERTTLYGLTLTAERTVNYGPVDPVVARELFIRGALVLGKYRGKAACLAHNRREIEAIKKLEHKSRRQDILIDDEMLYGFYDAKVPKNITTGQAFDKWYREAARNEPDLLLLSQKILMQHDAKAVTADQYPGSLVTGNVPLSLKYNFAPGAEDDGVSVALPLALLNSVDSTVFEYLVPGLIEEKLSALIRSLPKMQRRHFVPVPDHAKTLAASLSPEDGALLPAMARRLSNITGRKITADDFRTDQLAPHHLMHFRILDKQGEQLAAGRDLDALRSKWGSKAEQDFNTATAWPIERTGITSWDFDTLPEMIETMLDGLKFKGFPALVETDAQVTIKVFPDPQTAKAAMPSGLGRLYQLVLAQETKILLKSLTEIKTPCLHYNRLGGCESLKRNIIDAAFIACFITGQILPRDKKTFTAIINNNRARLGKTVQHIYHLTTEVLEKYSAINKALSAKAHPSWLPALQEMRNQCDRLVYPDFVIHTPLVYLSEIPRYLQAIIRRLEKLKENAGRDTRLAAEIRPWQDKLDMARAQEPDLMLDEFGWLLQEWRVSLFAQELKTRQPVSAKRIDKAWRALRA